MSDKINMSDAKRLAEKFKAVRNRSEFARKFGVPGGSAMIYQHINGLRPISLKAAQIYAQGLKCSLEEISPALAEEARSIKSALDVISTEVQEEQEPYIIKRKVLGIADSSENTSVFRVKFAKVKAEAGTEFSISQEIEGNSVFLRQDFIHAKGYDPEKLIAMYVQGPDMEPSLYEGDIVVVDITDTMPKDSSVFTVNYEGEIVIKRIVRDAGKWWLSSDNTDQRRFPRKEYFNDVCSIIGKIIYKQSERI